MSEGKIERLKRLFEDNDLLPEDVMKLELGGKKIPIILRTGIDKIQARNGIDVTYELLYHSPELKTAIMKATGTKGERKIETFAEVSPSNCKSPYPIMICEKRAMSRAVLKLAGFYELGAFGEGEITERELD